MKEYLFTYGYLKRAYANDPALRVPKMPIKWVGEGFYNGLIYRIANYPGVEHQPNTSSKVHGDVYLIVDNPFFLRRMDHYELSRPLFRKGHFEYKRVKRSILLNKKKVECWVYEYARPFKPLKLIKSGKY